MYVGIEGLGLHIKLFVSILKMKRNCLLAPPLPTALPSLLLTITIYPLSREPFDCCVDSPVVVARRVVVLAYSFIPLSLSSCVLPLSSP